MPHLRSAASTAPLRRTSCHSRTIESTSWKFGRQRNRRPGGRAFSILKAAVDVTERAEVAALGQR